MRIFLRTAAGWNTRLNQARHLDYLICEYNILISDAVKNNPDNTTGADQKEFFYCKSFFLIYLTPFDKLGIPANMMPVSINIVFSKKGLT